MASSSRRDDWRPVDVDGLEPNAEDAVRAEQNCLVVAGPGAGKSELLAQRACFLLQTGTCADPRRILAISFKRDAARNLRERVVRRCGRELASRFDSYTFDSFSKGLVDRFLSALPDPFRPRPDYTVMDGRTLNDGKIVHFIREMPSKGSALSTARREGLNMKRTWWTFIGRYLPADGQWKNESDEQIAAAELWSHFIHGATGSAVAFPMLGLLAELLLRTNPEILAALRKSYRFVFLDEFQDTTGVHYALVKRAFRGSGSVLTAVGDEKQRIMVWAGAVKRAFDLFEQDFGATRLHLTRNYRSAQNLVKIQSVVAKSLTPNAVEAIAMDGGANGPGECRVISFQSESAEAQQLAAMIREWIVDDGIPPREVCVLCRMKTALYTDRLRDALSGVGIRSRIENELQDLLSEPVSECLIDLLKLGCRKSAPDSWTRTIALLADLNGDQSETSMRQVVDGLLSYLPKLKAALAAESSTEEQIADILQHLIDFVGEDEFKAANPQYLQGDWFHRNCSQLAAALSEARNGRDWSSAIDEVEGLDSVPMMTTHKSKGLEYHTIVFVGLEDGAHFTFAGNENEETCGFFVALSRAKKRAVFTFSGTRKTGRNGSTVTQRRNSVEPLYKLLTTAGVAIEEHAG